MAAPAGDLSTFDVKKYYDSLPVNDISGLVGRSINHDLDAAYAKGTKWTPQQIHNRKVTAGLFLTAIVELILVYSLFTSGVAPITFIATCIGGYILKRGYDWWHEPQRPDLDLPQVRKQIQDANTKTEGCFGKILNYYKVTWDDIVGYDLLCEAFKHQPGIYSQTANLNATFEHLNPLQDQASNQIQQKHRSDPYAADGGLKAASDCAEDELKSLDLFIPHISAINTIWSQILKDV